MGDITLAQAQALVETAMKKATEIDTLMNIAVVDAVATSRPLPVWMAPGSAASISP